MRMTKETIKIFQISFFIIFSVIVFFPSFVQSQENSDVVPPDGLEENVDLSGDSIPQSVSEKKVLAVPQGEFVGEISSSELVRLSWEASSRRDLKKLDELVDQCVRVYGPKAKEFQSQLTGFPSRGEEEKYQILNDVGTCLFIKAEAVMNDGQTEEAKKQFQDIIDQYPSAQAWDPSRGSYWSVAEKSQDSLDVITGKRQEEIDKEPVSVVRTKPILHAPSPITIVDYTLYGKFHDVGTKDYYYEMTDPRGLADAVGEGIYPNVSSVYNNPRYKQVRKEGRLKGKHWDFVNSDDLEAAYFKWATAPEPPGIKLFYLGMIFEKAKMYSEALKAYHSLIVHFPKTVAWTYWQTPWYPASAAISKIRHIIRFHPELNLDSKHMKITVQNAYDNDPDNDIMVVYPGRIIPKGFWIRIREMMGFEEKESLGKVVKKLGEGQVRLVQYKNGHWQLLVDSKPYIIKGITYAPTRVGETPDKGTLRNWMEQDCNKNGRIDGPYDSWVDENGNNVQDDNEPVVGDFKLMKDMGVNTIRIYHQPQKPDKNVLRAMFEEYGIRVIMGDFLGKYTLGSGADWFSGTDYENPEHRKNMLESVKEMVMEYKDEPYILLWVLGNENNYGVASNADRKPEAYFQFVDEVAQWIKSVDANHPVAVNNGDTLFLDIFAKNSPNVDIFTANVYRGDYGFGSFWEQVSDASGKPTYISEYGCPAFAKHLTLEEAEEAQAEYHKGNWLDIQENTAGYARGSGNSIGGVVFEWLDEWWKNYEPFLHDRKSDAIGPFPGGYYFEEWFGIVGQGKGRHSPYLRQLRKSYFLYKDLWHK